MTESKSRQHRYSAQGKGFFSLPGSPSLACDFGSWDGNLAAPPMGITSEFQARRKEEGTGQMKWMGLCPLSLPSFPSSPKNPTRNFLYHLRSHQLELYCMAAPLCKRAWKTECVEECVCVCLFRRIAVTLQDSIKIIWDMGTVVQPPETWPSQGPYVLHAEVEEHCCPHFCDSLCNLGHRGTMRSPGLIKSLMPIALLFLPFTKLRYESMGRGSPCLPVPVFPTALLWLKVLTQFKSCWPCHSSSHMLSHLWLFGGSSWIPCCKHIPY